MELKEKRIKKLTRIYYSNPKIQDILLKFSSNREVIPRYYLGFGKRPDTILYISDINGLVKKGATSFHSSMELWEDPFKINSDMSVDEMNQLRIGWDLVFDIDSPYLDYSKIAAKLLIEAIESYGIKNYGIKFSGSKGFHIIISRQAFPKKFNDMKNSDNFPNWPRLICMFLMDKIKPKYNQEVTKLGVNFKALKARTNLSKEDISEAICPSCGKIGKKGLAVTYLCPECKTTIKRKNPKITKRILTCINNECPGKFDIIKKEDYFYCEHCKSSSWNKLDADKRYKIVRESGIINNFEENFKETISGTKLASLDLVLVATRHLFRMPYSLHEKTALASVVIKKEEIENFNPVKDANPLKLEIREFLPKNNPDEGIKLLSSALEWGAKNEIEETPRIYNYNFDISGVTEDMFPKPIKKLLKGLKDGKKRGLFVLITFFKSLNFNPEYINNKIGEWNKLNVPPLKEGYIKSQIDWHLKQKKKILPPNYSNESFYRDIGILEEKPNVKNPLVEVSRKVRNTTNANEDYRKNHESVKK